LFYAESWALVHYLIQGNEGKHLHKLSRFLDLLLKNTAVETALRDALQTDYAGLEKELKAYIQRSSYRINVATFEKKLEFDSQLQTAPLTDAEAQAYLGDLLYHTQRAEDASQKLQQALLLDPNLPIAHASLGMVRMAQKNFVEAKQHLAKAVEGNSQSYLAHYYYAFALSREGMTEGELVAGYPAETAHLMRTELQKAIELNPGYPESYHLLAFVNLVTGQNLDESIQLIKKALALSPGSEEYLFVLTQVYLHKQDFEAARKVVEPLSVNSSDPRIRATAESLLKSISAIQEQMARARAEHEKAGQRSGSGNFVTQVGSISTTSDRNVAEPVDPSSYLQEALKAPAAGEVRMQGVLTQIDCGPKGIVFTISVGDTLLKLQTKSFDDIDITTFSTEVGGEITCGVRKIKNAVVVCYLPSKDARSKTDGIAKSLDFVPPDFKLSGKQ
jgi:tetratricopeptide (TPR) repeat protein